jgi:hypothetical protein
MERIILLLFGLAMVSCQKTDISGFNDKPVVEAYLYADSIPVVKISKLIPFSSDMEFTSMDVTKLEVTITELSSGKQYLLASQGDGTYRKSDLIISAGKSYKLSFPYNDVMVTAETTIPEKPQSVTFSASSMIVSQRGEPGIGGGTMPTMPSPIEINWANSDQSYYLLVVKNIEIIKEWIDTKEISSGDFFRNQPVNTGYTELNPRSFKYYGYHLVTLFKVQPEYVIFFQETSNSSLSLTEINANVKNGYGIFTGINGYSTYVLVGKP